MQSLGGDRTTQRRCENVVFVFFLFLPAGLPLRNDSVANYASIWTLFPKTVTRPDVLCNALNISQIRL